ncbi:MerR family transcriptional regulator [Actinoplanes italicus]|uniref:Effector-binding domain-containing protein n=1 Tax=Actinoplanes italicus TaxID=113567 RepID=A0A2T0J8Q8_9ACTN|nr:GyrI-like domain-containing protein [Actinoplanes italicus]PRX04033.1 effector-binding domain-containing protein [Actinoplanes italicus]GIE30741.1 MerR family transcriptional regulator [Actinoplanes italicus]
MDGILPISAFSRATLISANTLRAYHESGLLEPAVVDPRTGYRGYRAAQFGDAAVIRDLRALDVPLAAIREVLAARDPAVTRRVLAEHQERMRAHQARIENALRVTAELLAEPAAVTPAAVTERELPPVTAYAVTGSVREEGFGRFLEQAYLALETEMNGTDPDGPYGALFPSEYLDEPAPVTAYIPAVGGPARLPGGRFAVAEFTGPYPEMSAGYRALGAWLAGTSHTIAGPVRERYLIGPGDGVPETGYRTEICWPLQLLEEEC